MDNDSGATAGKGWGGKICFWELIHNLENKESWTLPYTKYKSRP